MIPGCREKKRKRKEKRKVGSRVQKQARKKIVLKESRYQQIFPSLLQSRDGDFATPSAIFVLSSATISSVTAAVVEPTPPRTNQRKPNKTARTRGLSQLRFHLLAEPVPCHTIYHSISAFLRQQHKNLYIPLATLSTISFLHSSTAAYKTYIFPCLY